MSGAGEGSKDLVPYEVGYGKPPTQHRFQKGQSGNPNGRPSRPKPVTVSTGFGMRPTEEFLKLEAYRLVTIREGEKVLEIPAIQAVFRAMGVAAMKGNRFAQRTMTQMVAQVEAEDLRLKMEYFGTAIDYKRFWDKEIARCREHGLPEPQPLPHPDDIVLDANTGDVMIKGPTTAEEKANLDKLIQRRQEAQDEVTEFAERHKRTRSARSKDLWLDQWHDEQQLFDLINDNLPGRYKTRLENRSWAEGASREGDGRRDYDKVKRGRKKRES